MSPVDPSACPAPRSLREQIEHVAAHLEDEAATMDEKVPTIVDPVELQKILREWASALRVALASENERVKRRIQKYRQAKADDRLADDAYFKCGTRYPGQ